MSVLMADIFISYARADRARVEKLASALEASGFSVWWDRNLAAGAVFTKETEAKLKDAKLVVVVWSKTSVDSMWVADEAGIGREKRNLVPIAIDAVEPPIGFRQFQTVAFDAWRGDASAPVFAELVEVLRSRLAGDAAPAPSARIKASWKSRLLRPAPIAAIAVAVLGLVGLSLFVLRAPPLKETSASPETASSASVTETSGAPTAAAAKADVKSVAVLPFADMSAAKDQEYFADGMAEEILNALVRVDGLRVAGRTSSFSFKNKNDDLRAIGAALNAAHILEGSVRKQGERVRITAQLIKADDGFHLWSETYDRDLKDVFAVQDEIARSVASALSIAIGAGDEFAAEGTANTAAHDLYLRARQLFATRNPAAIRQAIALFEAAAVLDPEYSAAYSGRGRALSVLLYFEDILDLPAVMEASEAAAARALELNPDNAEAHATLAQINTVYHWNWEAADAAMRRAIELAPNHAELVNFAGDHYRHRSDFEKAEAFELRATELNPLHAVNFSDLAYIRLYRRRYAEAADAAREATRLDAGQINGWAARALAEAYLGRFVDANASLKRLGDVAPESAQFEDVRAEIANAAGDRATADAAIEALRRLADEGLQAEYGVAHHLANRGDFAEAAEALEAAYRKRDIMFVLDDRRLIPEDWPDHPAIRAALDKPELNALYAIRRANLARVPRDD